MSESTMSSRICKALRGLDPQRVENGVGPGTPDVNFINGWIENKWLRSWPCRPDTVVRFEHYTPQQKIWARRRKRSGGNVWLLLCVGKEWLLFDGLVATEVFGKSTRQELYDAAQAVWMNGLKDEEIRRCLLRNWLDPRNYSCGDDEKK